MDTVKAFPPIRVFGTIGFICAMLTVDFTGLQHNYGQFFMSGGFSILLAIYALFMPKCPVNKNAESSSLVDVFGLRAFTLFKQKKMAIFFIFSMLLCVSLQITNGFANPFLTAFEGIKEYADTFAAQHANALISLSQISETLCILLIPFCMKRFCIKNVMLIAMFAWVFRFGFFGLGNPGMPGVILFVLSCVVYGVAFDFFNISGALFVDQNTDADTRSSAQGLFMMMTNGFGATVGTLSAQAVVNTFVYDEGVTDALAGWRTSWFIFAGYALVLLILFGLIFRPKKKKDCTL
jgi:nucleoside transporter